jgi:hypothetical protein
MRRRWWYPRVALALVLSFVVAAGACGGRVGPSPATEDAGASEDASKNDASVFDARGVRDSRAPLDVTRAPDAPVADRAPPGPEASLEASMDAPVDVFEASVDAPIDVGTREDAGQDAATGCIDSCDVGEKQCDYDAVDCEGGPSVCVIATLSTCMHGSSGCTVWGPATMCSPSYGCCVPCHYAPCFDGSPTMCEVCPVGPLGGPCMQDADCGSDACDGITETCVGDQCSDRRQDGFETDVDCGGGTCRNGCGVGQRCINSFDCESGHFCALPAHVCQ